MIARVFIILVLFFPVFVYADMLKRINVWRVDQGLPEVVYSETLCGLADVRLSVIQDDFSHDGFYRLFSNTRGRWFENLAHEGRKIRGEGGVFKAWLNSPKHELLLHSDIRYGCVVNENGYWVFLGYTF